MDDAHPADSHDDSSEPTDAPSTDARTDPAGVPDDVRRRVDRLRRLATLLDDSIRVPVIGYRIGVDPLIGLLPVGGDLAMTALSSVVVVEAWRLGAPESVLVRMLVNVAVDTVVGSVPILGNIFDAAWKANLRNVDLLERWLEGQAAVASVP